MAEKSWQAEVKDWVISIGIALILAFFIRTFIVELYLVDGPSMEPTLENNNRLVVSKFIYNIRKPERGEVIVFKYPLDEDRDFVKRVIAIPGDKVEIKEGVVYVNNKAVSEPYMKRELRRGEAEADKFQADNYEARVVPVDTVFVLGDNRYNSRDSRYRDVGFVSEEMIKGKALMVFWPFSNWKTLP